MAAADVRRRKRVARIAATVVAVTGLVLYSVLGDPVGLGSWILNGLVAGAVVMGLLLISAAAQKRRRRA
jgi:hypothetical protein